MPKSRKLRPSSTPGKAKGANCQRTQLKTIYAKDSKLYKTNPELYHLACIEVGKLKGNYPVQP